jgi:glycerate 2-kinase
VSAIACDTDGTDGTTDAAGAWVDAGSLEKARLRSLDQLDALHRHDSGGFFEAMGQQIVTGPTQTNVNDFRAILIGSEPSH